MRVVTVVAESLFMKAEAHTPALSSKSSFRRSWLASADQHVKRPL